MPRWNYDMFLGDIQEPISSDTLGNSSGLLTFALGETMLKSEHWFKKKKKRWVLTVLSGMKLRPGVLREGHAGGLMEEKVGLKKEALELEKQRERIKVYQKTDPYSQESRRSFKRGLWEIKLRWPVQLTKMCCILAFHGPTAPTAVLFCILSVPRHNLNKPWIKRVIFGKT